MLFQCTQQGAVLPVVNPHDPFFPTSENQCTVGTGSDGLQEVGSTLVAANIAAIIYVPLPQTCIATSADNLGNSTQHGQPADLFSMPGDGADLLRFLVVPNLKHIVSTSGDKHLAIGPPGNIQDMMRMAFVVAQLLARLSALSSLLTCPSLGIDALDWFTPVF